MKPALKPDQQFDFTAMDGIGTDAPLYILFEDHLLNHGDPHEDRHAFVFAVVDDYLARIRSKGLVVPKNWEPYVRDELALQVNRMLIKKIYGCLTINEYVKKIPIETKKKARKRAAKLK